MSKIKLCWQCNKRLKSTFASIEFNGSSITVHKVCKKDAENLLFIEALRAMRDLADAWIHAEARARAAEFWLGVYENSPGLNPENDEPLEQTNWEDDDWIAAVKAEMEKKP